MIPAVENLISDIDRVPPLKMRGRVSSVQGLMVEVNGIERVLSIGSRIYLHPDVHRAPVPAEVVGFRNGRALAMPYGSLDGIGMGCEVFLAESQAVIRPDGRWLGRVINALGDPIDGKGPLPPGGQIYNIRQAPPPAHSRQRVGSKIDLGLRSINTFLTTCRGQRMGIFAGSGVGKSVSLSMMARYTEADIIVIGLIGERGREVQEFIEDNLGPEGLARSVVVVATSDEPPLMRRQAAHMTLAVAEYFRDMGNDVLCLMDSVTRFAMAMREIGLSTGEPPASKGYTPSVFAELPRLLERAGPGTGQGSITGLFTVLVEGDDHNEPIADAVRGILDGHIVLERAIADRGRYPAVNILRSVSRMMPDCNNEEENHIVTKARAILATYEEMSELIRLGAYRRGSDPAIDEAIDLYPRIETFLGQGKTEQCDLASGYQQLADIIGYQTAAALAQQGAQQGMEPGPDGQMPNPENMTVQQQMQQQRPAQ